MKYLLFLLFLLLKAGTATAQNNLVVNGIPWFDDKGNIVNAHGACIVEENGRYYLFGEWKSDKSNAFPGFSCYSSDDLVNWKFENIVLRVQPEGILGPNRVGERVKVMKCPKTSRPQPQIRSLRRRSTRTLMRWYAIKLQFIFPTA